jgi:hypothetical protein
MKFSFWAESIIKKIILKEEDNAPRRITNNKDRIEFLNRVFNVKTSTNLGAKFSLALGSNFLDPEKILNFEHPEIESIRELPSKAASASYWFELKLKNNRGTIRFKDTTESQTAYDRQIKSETNDKELTPVSLGLAKEKNLYTREELLSAAKKAIKNKPSLLKEIMESMIDSVYTIKGRSNDFKINIQGLNEKLQKISGVDEANIMKDFGEIISAVAIADDGDEIYFPTNVKHMLVDFFIKSKNGEAESYSAKFNKGANPSVIGIVSAINANKIILKDSEEEKKLYEVLSIIEKNTAKEGIHLLSKHLGLDDEAKKIKKSSVGKKRDWTENEFAEEYSKYIACRNFLNKEKVLNEETYADILSKTINTVVNIKQAYLIYKAGDTISFKIKNFKDEKFEFAISNSSNKINKMSFKMI